MNGEAGNGYRNGHGLKRKYSKQIVRTDEIANKVTKANSEKFISFTNFKLKNQIKLYFHLLNEQISRKKKKKVNSMGGREKTT